MTPDQLLQDSSANSAASAAADAQITTPATTQARRPRWGQILAWVGLAALLFVLFLGLLRTQQGPIGIGKQAPDFTFTSFKGETLTLSELRGKVVVVNFWASWCKPC